MIIGLTGTNGAGKGSVAEMLIKRGFQYYSLSDILREELTKEEKEIKRDTLIEIGNRLRLEHGPSVLADMIANKLDIDKNYCVDSIRNPFEAERLKQLPEFHLINVEAPQDIRFERCKSRAREGAETTFEEFQAVEEKELESKDSNAQQLLQTARLADYNFDNSGDLVQLETQTVALLKDRASKMHRPSWDEYFMNIAKVVAMRSNCVKRHVAAVIVKENRIISTGYNGTPRGIRNCYEGGCARCNSFGESGKDLGECICSHAEENSITQAAYHGVAIKGATIYTTFSPCIMCTKMIINSGISEVIYGAEYSMNKLELSLLKEAGVRVRAL